MIAALLALALAAAPEAVAAEAVAAMPVAVEDVSPPPLALEEPTITLLAAGDVTLGQHYETFLAERQAKDGWDWPRAVAYGFERIKPVTTAADIFVVNLECPFSWRGEKIAKNFTFRAAPELSAALIDGGVDAVSLANNHLYDYGPDALFDTLTTLRAQRLPFFGAGENLLAARRPAIVERGGIKVALLGYFYLGERNIEPEQVYAADAKPGVAGCFRGADCIGDMVEADVRAALYQADLVVPFFHWGREAQDEVQPYQRTLAKRAIDAGAKLVLGSHPHVIHGIEQYKGVPIVYSLGNFIFGGNWGPKNETALAVRVRLARSGVKSLEALPMRYTNPPDFRFQPRFLEGEEAKPVLEKLRMLSAVLDEKPPAPQAGK